MRLSRARFAPLALLLVGAMLFGQSGVTGGDAPVAEAAVIGSAGTSVTISGVNFTSTTGVMFGEPSNGFLIPIGSKCANASATGCLVSQAATSIVVRAPSTFPQGAPFGFVPITVCTNGASVSSCASTSAPYLPTGGGPYSPPPGFSYGPSITKISPVAGIGGTKVTISGGMFGTEVLPSVAFVNSQTGQPAATVGGPNASKCTSTQHGCIGSFADSSVVVSVPDNLPKGLYYLQLETTNGGAFSLSPPLFTTRPAIYSASPVGGQAGTTITIKGANFGKDGAISVKFHGIGASFADVVVSQACSASVTVGCVDQHQDSSITVKAPANSPTGAPFGPFEMTVGGVPADWMNTSQPQGPSFSYVPIVSGPASASYDKPGGKLQVKGANFGALAGVQIGQGLFVADKCTAARTESCISSQTDQLIVVKPPSNLTGSQPVSVVAAKLGSTGSGFSLQPVFAIGGFMFDWTTGPVVTGVS